MGDRNSSVTRVWPVFDCLLHGDATGKAWLPALISLAKTPAASRIGRLDLGTLLPEVSHVDRKIPGNVKVAMGADRAQLLGCVIRNAFEKDLPPSRAFLEWMLGHPQKLIWPKDSKGKKRDFGAETQERRKHFMACDPNVSAVGLGELDKLGAEGSRRKWWAFEGWTSVDCWLETERFVLLIEGKRTEGISHATDWYPTRNQLVRNVEVAAEYAGARGKDFGVLLCSEQALNLPAAAFDDSLPHLSAGKREELKEHYLGCVTWEQIRSALCPQLTLPDGLDKAVKTCMKFRI